MRALLGRGNLILYINGTRQIRRPDGREREQCSAMRGSAVLAYPIDIVRKNNDGRTISSTRVDVDEQRKPTLFAFRLFDYKDVPDRCLHNVPG